MVPTIRQLGLAAGLALGLSLGPVRAEEVDLELILAVDISGSMEFDEALTQRRGYVEALRHPEVVRAIQSGLLGKIALTVVEWAGPGIQFIAVPWTVVEDQESAESVAVALSGMPLFQYRGTSISSSLLFTSALFQDNGFEGTRRVIDISGDGPNNMGVSVVYVRDMVLAEGIVINGLPIMINPSGMGLSMLGLDVYYEDCVIGGPGSFIIPVDSADQFAEAIRRKLVLEIAAAPAPPADAELIPVQTRVPRIDCFIGERMRGIP
ncbi:MAG: DUF1194 domain-containing protein [Bauldia sp.]|nr:DUF1194 domain-containing protein [Bauldia sp.]